MFSTAYASLGLVNTITACLDMSATCLKELCCFSFMEETERKREDTMCGREGRQRDRSKGAPDPV